MSAAICPLDSRQPAASAERDYIRTARAKGLRERAVVYVHALRNSLIPVVTILGPLLAAVLTGTFVVELIFCHPWPLAIHLFRQRDAARLQSAGRRDGAVRRVSRRRETSS